MTPEAIVHYLRQHPEFFEEQIEFLSTVALPHPHGGRTVSISERQILTLREKGKQLEDKLRELIEFGEQNDVIGEKMHRLTLAMIATRDAVSAIQALYFHLREDFSVPHTAIRLWPQWDHPQTTEFSEVSMASRDFATSLGAPYCSPKSMVDTADWFGEVAPHLRSFAYVALKSQDSTIGLLAMASEDAQRFYPEMGTLYLKRLGDIAATTLLRYLA